MKMVKNLTISNIRKYEGFARREDLDFSDDGNRFRGFSYKGLPITTLRSDDTTYLAIRVDYLNTEFTYREWMDTEEYILCDKFNGVYEFDMEELIETLEKIITKVDEMNAKAKAEVIDVTDLEIAISHEIDEAEDVVESFKKNFKWYDCPTYRLNSLIGLMNQAEKRIEAAKNVDFSSMSNAEKREARERLEKYGYVKIRKDSYELKMLAEAIEG